MEKRRKHINIPVFIPQLACPFKCVFCDQEKISGVVSIPDALSVTKTIDTYLTSVKDGDEVELAFFGGTFTGMSQDEQLVYLDAVQPYLEKGLVESIRISTRPDYIDKNILSLLKEKGVKTIELGAQSMVDSVLEQSYRGHTYADVSKAAALIKDFGFSLGLQMMLGLPGDCKEHAIATAQKIIDLDAENIRIYPTVVIAGTHLNTMYQKGEYQELSMEDAIDWAKSVYLMFENSGIDILRVGLHPSDELNNDSFIAGPYHSSFREFVLTSIWADILDGISLQPDRDIEIYVHPKEINYAIGYSSQNRVGLEHRYRRVLFKTDSTLRGRNYHVDYCK